MAIDAATRRMIEVFFCYDQHRGKQVIEQKRQLAHYTTADTAMKIIQGRSIWLRNVAVMNDYAEVHYGWQVLTKTIENEGANGFRAALDGISDGLADEVLQRHSNFSKQAREVIFTASLSEHDRRDELGRLSMWRAYGGPVAGVALLFRGDVVQLEVEPSLELNVSPVLYGGLVEFAREFEVLTQQIATNIEFLRGFERQLISNVATALLQFATISIKHPGFAEEKEWRVVHRPYEFSSASVIAKPVTIGGVPQTIYELPFHHPSKGELFNIPQLDLNSVLEGIILGPCAYPETIFRAFVDAMTDAGIEDAKSRIKVSHIPLRQQW